VNSSELHEGDLFTIPGTYEAVGPFRVKRFGAPDEEAFNLPLGLDVTVSFSPAHWREVADSMAASIPEIPVMYYCLAAEGPHDGDSRMYYGNEPCPECVKWLVFEQVRAAMETYALDDEDIWRSQVPDVEAADFDKVVAYVRPTLSSEELLAAMYVTYRGHRMTTRAFEWTGGIAVAVAGLIRLFAPFYAETAYLAAGLGVGLVAAAFLRTQTELGRSTPYFLGRYQHYFPRLDRYIAARGKKKEPSDMPPEN